VALGWGFAALPVQALVGPPAEQLAVAAGSAAARLDPAS